MHLFTCATKKTLRFRSPLNPKGIDDFKKGKAVKIGISSANLADSVLAHEDGSMGIVEEIAREVRDFSDNLLRNHRVLLGRYQNVESWRSKQRLDEVPRLSHIPWSPHYPWVRCHSEELIKDRPGRIPRVRAPSLAFQPAAAAGVKWRITVSGVHEDVRIDNEHYRPSMAW
jgi:hypothetical protein